MTAGNQNTGVGTLANIQGDVVVDDTVSGVTEFLFVDNSGDTANRTWTIDSPAANRGRIALAGAPAIAGTITFDDFEVEQVDLFGGLGDDQFTVDLSGGNIDDPLPFTNLDIFGGGQGAGGDSMVLTDTVNTHGTVTHNFTNDNDGTVVFNDQTPQNDTIRYFGLEPILDNLNVNNRVFNFAMASTAIELSQFDATHTRIESPVNEMVDFTTPGTSLVINLAAGTNTIDVTGFAGDYNTPTTTIEGNTGVDTFNVNQAGLPATGVLEINGDDPTTFPGDVLNYDGDATKTVTGVNEGTLSAAGFADVDFFSIEQLSTTPPGLFDDVIDIASLPGGNDGNPNELTVQLDATGTLIQFLFDGDTGDATPAALVSQQLVASVNSITVNGSGDDDTLLIDDANGLPFVQGDVPGTVADDTDNPLIPGAPNLLFNGGTGFDALSYNLNAGATNQTYAIGEGDGGGIGAGMQEGEVLTEDGVNSLNIYFTGLEPITTMGVPGGTLTVLGDVTANVLQVIDADAVGGPAGFTRVRETSGPAEFFDFAAGAFTSLEVYGMGGADSITQTSLDAAEAALATILLDGDSNVGGDTSADTINVLSLPAAVTATLMGGAGNDTFNISSDAPTNAGTLDTILGSIVVNGDDNAGGPSTVLKGNALLVGDILNISDAGDGGNNTYNLSATTFDRPTAAPATGTVTYATIETVNLTAGSGNDTINVTSTAASVNTTVNGGVGTDTITLSSTGASSNVFLNGQADADTINVRATAAGSATEVNGGTENDVVNISSDAPTNAGNLDSILGDICVNGDANAGGPSTVLKGNALLVGDILNISDAGDGGNNTYNLSATTFDRPAAAPATGTVIYATIETVNVTAGSGNDTINVTSTAASVNTTVNGGAGGDAITLSSTGAGSNVFLNGQAGSDAINVEATAAGSATEVNGGDNTDVIDIGTPANSLSGILGEICVNGDAHDAGTIDLTIKGDTNTLDLGDILILSDQADPGSFTYALDATTFNRTGTATVTYMTIETLSLNTSIGAATVNVATTAAGINTFITTQDEADDVNVTTTGVDSNLTINTAGGADTIDFATTGGDGGDADIFGSFTSVNAGDGADVITVNNSGVQSRMQLNGDADDDIFDINGTGANSRTQGNGNDDNDTFNVQANALGVDSELMVLGDDGNDIFNFNYAADTTSSAAMIMIEGNASAADTDNRDVINIDTSLDSGGFADPGVDLHQSGQWRRRCHRLGHDPERADHRNVVLPRRWCGRRYDSDGNRGRRRSDRGTAEPQRGLGLPWRQSLGRTGAGRQRRLL